MGFAHKGIEYFIGLYSSKTTLSIPAVNNYFKELELKKIDSAHLKAQNIIEDELSRISEEKSNNI
ncbi:hypothetical protein [uncultured Chryseobacterium sp.]|uniref:hypothetical protein n=1 Tax=uncultured Chryseobacterium sp. TaxID=259322 RepID=UPI0025EE6B20|nr:hypothetical protein [uncultured Chryseobacterium sp.]